MHKYFVILKKKKFSASAHIAVQFCYKFLLYYLILLDHVTLNMRGF